MTNKNLTLEDFLASITPEDNSITIVAYTADHTAHVREVTPCHRRRIELLPPSNKDMRRKIDYAIKERISARNWQPRVPSTKKDKLMNRSFHKQLHVSSRFRVNRFQ